MRLTRTKIDVVTRTTPISSDATTSRLTADGVHGPYRLQAHLYHLSDGEIWRVHRYAYRLTGGAVRRCNVVNLKLVSDGAVQHAFESGRDVVNDGRWYVHDHASEVPKRALTYARFEAWFDVPGLAQLALGDGWEPIAGRPLVPGRLGRARDRDARARVGPRARHAQDVERSAERP